MFCYALPDRTVVAGLIPGAPGEHSGLAIGDDERTESELEENLRYSRTLSAEFVNTRIVVPVDDEVARRLRDCAVALRTQGAREGGTGIALEFSSGSQLRSVSGYLWGIWLPKAEFSTNA